MSIFAKHESIFLAASFDTSLVPLHN